MSATTIHYQPKLSPIRPKDECECAGPDALVIGSRIVGKGSKTGIACDARLCMACGTIRGAIEFNHYHHALAHFWAEWGWNRTIGLRLKEIADLCTDTPFESFCALRSGMSPAECAAYSAAA